MSGEYHIEPIRGLPEQLPAGEVILWQGEPKWRSLARRAFHTRKVMIYCALLLAWRFSGLLYDGGSLAQAVLGTLSVLPIAAAAVGLLALLAYAFARTTVFTITNRRVVIRFGVAFPMTFNLPFRTIASADLRVHGDGTGDISLQLQGPDRIAYLHLWPFARPWRLARAEPTLRCIEGPEEVAMTLSKALAGEPAEPIVTPRSIRVTSAAAMAA